MLHLPKLFMFFCLWDKINPLNYLSSCQLPFIQNDWGWEGLVALWNRLILMCFLSDLKFVDFTGVLYQRKGLHKEALQAFGSALDIDPTHVPSLISTALVLKKLSEKSNAVIRSFLMAALRLDRMNPSAWYNLGLVYKSEGTKCSALEAAECFQVAATLEESAPVEPFR